jgi:DNA polymerase III subunit delta
MAGDLQADDVLQHLRKGKLYPVYLFHGPSRFRMERLLSQIREDYIPETERDFNVEIFYGGEIQVSTIMDAARSLPFMSRNRLIIVRRTEAFSPASLESFIPYLENPSPSTCLIFVSGKTDFKRKFFKKMRTLGWSVAFNRLREAELIPWLKRTAKGMGLDIDGEACGYLLQVVGNSLQELYSELEKLSLRHEKGHVGAKEVKDLAIFSRVYTVFELMDELSFKRVSESLTVLNRFLAEGDKGGALRILGMIQRQIKLISQTKRILDKGGQVRDLPKKLGIPNFLGNKIALQSKRWSLEELEKALHLLYRSDGLLKTGASDRTVLENLVISLCL